MLKNHTFAIEFDAATGGLHSLRHLADQAQMNWCEGVATWGTLKDFTMQDCRSTDCHLEAVYRHVRLSLEAKVTRTLLPNGNYGEHYCFNNTGSLPLFFKRGDLGIYTTFNDNYEAADICMTQRCHTHIWCGGETSYVNALKMGGGPFNLGLVLTRGSLSDYSVERNLQQSSNDRGDFILHPSPFTLMPGASYELNWELFWHNHDDFSDKLLAYANTVLLESAQDTVFDGENITVSGRTSAPIRQAAITLDEKNLPCQVDGNRLNFVYRPQRCGEHKFKVVVNGVHTFIKCFVTLKSTSCCKIASVSLSENNNFISPAVRWTVLF